VEWRPFATAPRDRIILVARHGDRVFGPREARWSEKRGCFLGRWQGKVQLLEEAAPTLWAERPDPPLTARESSKINQVFRLLSADSIMPGYIET
jgi:hypothetical protein